LNQEVRSAQSEDSHCATVRPLPPNSHVLVDAAPPCRRGSAFRQNDFLSTDGAIQRVDQHLNLDELVACPLGLVPVKGAASTFACTFLSSIMRARAFFSVSSRSLIQAP
jgi:hypothetical protein